MIKMKNVGRELARLSSKFHASADSKAALAVGSLRAELAAATPVDTGEARASWSSRKSVAGHVVENSADHIQYLNAGSSEQAPALFVERIALKYGKPVGTIVDVKQD